MIRLRNMTPDLVFVNNAHRSGRDIEHASDGNPGHSIPSQTPYQSNVKFGKLVAPVRLSFVLTVLFTFIGNVFGLCSKKQVSRIYARRVVAVMKNKPTIGDFSKSSNPRKPVSRYWLSVYRKNSVAIRAEFCRFPNPASFRVRRFINLLPESLLYRSHNQKNTHQPRSEVRIVARQRNWQVSNLDSLFFAATSRPELLY